MCCIIIFCLFSISSVGYQQTDVWLNIVGCVPVGFKSCMQHNQMTSQTWTTQIFGCWACVSVAASQDVETSGGACVRNVGHFAPASTCNHLQATQNRVASRSTAEDMLALHDLAIISGTNGCPHHCSRNLSWNGHGSCLLIQQLEFSKPSDYRNDGQRNPHQA